MAIRIKISRVYDILYRYEIFENILYINYGIDQKYRARGQKSAVQNTPLDSSTPEKTTDCVHVHVHEKLTTL